MNQTALSYHSGASPHTGDLNNPQVPKSGWLLHYNALLFILIIIMIMINLIYIALFSTRLQSASQKKTAANNCTDKNNINSEQSIKEKQIKNTDHETLRDKK